MSKQRGIFKAAVNGEIDTIKSYLNSGTDINEVDGKGFTPLLLAIQQNHYALVQMLISNGADIRKRAYYSYSPFELAVDCQVKLTPFFKFLHLKLTPLFFKHRI